jgi:hypothetical protein
MAEIKVYYPPRRRGTILHLFLIVLLAAAGAWGIWGVSTVQMAPRLLPYLLLISLSLTAVPYLIYRLYGLHRASYSLQREGVSLHWGWRSESIPMSQIRWIHHIQDLEESPHPPVFHWPGAVTGVRRFQRGPEVEFLASRTRDLVIIATNQKYFAISPNRAQDFVSSYNEMIELGSLSPLAQESLRPTLVLSEISGNRIVLGLLMAGGILTLTQLIWTLRVIPARQTVSLGFSPSGIPHQPLESVRLILFPIITTTAFLANLILGLFLFRNLENRSLAYILWGGSILIGILFHITMLFIL